MSNVDGNDKMIDIRYTRHYPSQYTNRKYNIAAEKCDEALFTSAVAWLEKYRPWASR